MLHILLGLLKIIGILIAVIIGLVLLVIFVVVFAALRYDVAAEADETIPNGDQGENETLPEVTTPSEVPADSSGWVIGVIVMAVAAAATTAVIIFLRKKK